MNRVVHLFCVGMLCVLVCYIEIMMNDFHKLIVEVTNDKLDWFSV